MIVKVSVRSHVLATSGGSRQKCADIRAAGGPPPEPSKDDVILGNKNR